MYTDFSHYHLATLIGIKVEQQPEHLVAINTLADQYEEHLAAISAKPDPGTEVFKVEDTRSIMDPLAQILEKITKVGIEVEQRPGHLAAISIKANQYQEHLCAISAKTDHSKCIWLP